jgi:hypothetical protein
VYEAVTEAGAPAGIEAGTTSNMEYSAKIESNNK